MNKNRARLTIARAGANLGQIQELFEGGTSPQEPPRLSVTWDEFFACVALMKGKWTQEDRRLTLDHEGRTYSPWTWAVYYLSGYWDESPWWTGDPLRALEALGIPVADYHGRMANGPSKRLLVCAGLLGLNREGVQADIAVWKVEAEKASGSCYEGYFRHLIEEHEKMLLEIPVEERPA